MNSTKNTSLSGIEYLRVILSVFVVAWHMGIAGRSTIFFKTQYRHHVYTLSDFFNFQLFLVAVPTFMLISAYLYVSKTRDDQYLLSRLKRLILLIWFWGILFNIHWYLSKGQFRITDINTYGSIITTIMRAGNTPYYFFVSLIVCLVITHSIRNLNTKILILGLLVSFMFLTLLPIMAQQYNYHNLMTFWNPLNFIVYPFSAILMVRKKEMLLKYFRSIIFICISMTVILSFLEWQLYLFDHQLEKGLRFPAYTRPSLTFSAFLLLFIALKFQPRLTKTIKFMSLYSLALYCIHPFIIWPNKIFNIILVDDKVLSSIINLTLVILLSYIIAWILRRFISTKLLF